MTARQALYDYESLGGRVFASHFHHIWFSKGPAPVPSIGTWGDLPDPQRAAVPPALPVPSVGTINTSFPKGLALSQWLVNVGASTTAGQLNIIEARDNLQAVGTAPNMATEWITVQNLAPPNPNAVQYVSYNAPLAVAPEMQCGRAVFTDLHVSATGSDPLTGGDVTGQGLAFPNGCNVMRDLSPQEKAVEFMLFDLSSCIQSDMEVPVPPVPEVKCRGPHPDQSCFLTASRASMPGRAVSTVHTFHALAFVENFPLKELAAYYPEAKRAHQHLWYSAPAGGSVFIYSFGAVVFLDLTPAVRDEQLLRLRRAPSCMRDARIVSEDFTVREVLGERPHLSDGALVVDTLSSDRASVVALTMAQSTAMEYYEGIVDQMFTDTDQFVQRLEKVGNISVFTAKLHRFIGAAISTRSEVISVLHLLDKPDVVWDDAGAEAIYAELRAEYDLVDRYQALELKLRSVQDSLSLLTDVARDRRLVFLETSVIALILLEIVLSVFRH